MLNSRLKLRPKRVIISATTLGLGGIHTHLTFLCQTLRVENVPLTVFATGSDWAAATLRSLEANGVKLKLAPRLLRETRKLALLYSALTWPIQVPRTAVSLYCIGAGRSHFLMNRLRPPKTVSINHEIVEPPGLKSLAGDCASRLDVTVANSTKVADKMRALWPHKPIRVIPFLTSDRPAVGPPGRVGIGARPLTVAYIGRMVEQKRPDQLVRSWSRLTAKSPLTGARLDLHGYDPTGTMTSQLRAFVSDSNLASQIRIHGEYKLADLPNILHAADFVVLPSLWEGLPLVLVEAMQHGVPFVATAAGGTEELADGNPDVVVTGTEWSQFEAGVLRMAGKLRAGEINRIRLFRWVEERYGFEVVSKQWVDCLQTPRSYFNLN